MTPTNSFRFLPPWSWTPEQPPLESAGISAQAETPTKATKGQGSIQGKKSNAELEPTATFGLLHLAAFGNDTVSGDGIAAVHAHNFERMSGATPQLFDWWDNSGNGQKGFIGCAANTTDLIGVKGEFFRLEQDWTGLFPANPAPNLSPVLDCYPTIRPLMFAQPDVMIGGSTVYDVTNAKISIKNHVVADAVLRSDTNFSCDIWSEGMEVSAEIEARFISITEYNKFLALASPSTLTESELELLITSAQTFDEGALLAVPFSFRYLMPRLFYRAAEIDYPTGVVVVRFTGAGLPDTGMIGAGGNAYAFTNRNLVAQFINGVATPF
jgi:hypothetical protein